MGMKSYRRNLATAEAIKLGFDNFPEVIEILGSAYLSHEECPESERVRIVFTNDLGHVDDIVVSSLYEGDWLLKSPKGFYKTNDATFKSLYWVE